MHQYARDLFGKNDREVMPHFFDAKDDVTEVICARLFCVHRLFLFLPAQRVQQIIIYLVRDFIYRRVKIIV